MEPNELERFEAVVLPHLDAAFTLARYLTGDTQDAQDVVQDAALRAVKYFGGFRGADAGAVFDEEQHSDGVAREDPAVEFDRKETRDRLREAVAQLPAEFREVIVLREIQDLSYQEISDITSAPVGTVMSRLSRARQRLRRALVHAGKEPVR